MTPIIIFKNERQAHECLRYWQSILGLQNWIIDIVLQYDEPCVAPAWGSSIIYRAIHVAEIYIPMPFEGQMNYFPQRYVQELILVHELLHILIIGYEVDHNTTEGRFFKSENHARLESIAKGLICAQYHIPRSWFNNF